MHLILLFARGLLEDGTVEEYVGLLRFLLECGRGRMFPTLFVSFIDFLFLFLKCKLLPALS